MLGTVLRASVDGKRGFATVKFSARDDVVPVWHDVVEGILRHISVGYTVEEWEESAGATGRVLTAVRWTPHELSLVPVPADPGARIRSGRPPRRTFKKEPLMTGKDAPAPSGGHPAGDPPVSAPIQPKTTHVPKGGMAARSGDDALRPRTMDEAVREAVLGRAAVNMEIRAIARAAGLDQDWIDRQIDAEADADTARRAAFEALMQRQAAAPALRTEQVRVETGEAHDDPVSRARHMGEALYARINPRHEPSGPSRRWLHATPVDLARELLTLRGESTLGLSPATLVTRALHTTSDFPLLLGDTVGRVLREAYQAAPAGVRLLGRQVTARDFRSITKIQLGEAPVLEKVNEAGEITSGTLAEAKEAYKVETWARKISLSRQIIVNDDLGAFADLARRMGQAAAETEARILVALLESGSGNGPVMSDGKALFHADHGNKAGTGAAIGDATLSDARLALRKQTGLSGQVIRVTPRYLLVPPNIETAAEKYLAQLAPAKAADVNPFSGSLTLVVEPRLSSTSRWYMTADPAEIGGLEYAHLAGAQGPQIETRSGWDVDGVDFRVMLDFGVGFVDWRGWYMNAGA